MTYELNVLSEWPSFAGQMKSHNAQYKMFLWLLNWELQQCFTKRASAIQRSKCSNTFGIMQCSCTCDFSQMVNILTGPGMVSTTMPASNWDLGPGVIWSPLCCSFIWINVSNKIILKLVQESFDFTDYILIPFYTRQHELCHRHRNTQ